MKDSIKILILGVLESFGLRNSSAVARDLLSIRGVCGVLPGTCKVEQRTVHEENTGCV